MVQEAGAAVREVRKKKRQRKKQERRRKVEMGVAVQEAGAVMRKVVKWGRGCKKRERRCKAEAGAARIPRVLALLGGHRELAAERGYGIHQHCGVCD